MMVLTLLCNGNALAQRGGRGGNGGGGNGGGETPVVTYEWISLGTLGAAEITERGDIVCFDGILKLVDASGNLSEVKVIDQLIAEGIFTAYDPISQTGAEGLSTWSINESRELVGFVHVWDAGTLDEICFYYRPGNFDYTPSTESTFEIIFQKPASYNVKNIVINNNGLVAGVTENPDDPTAGQKLFLWSTGEPTADPRWLGSSSLGTDVIADDHVEAINDSNVICGSHRGTVEYGWTFSLDSGFVGIESNGGLLDGYARDMNQLGEIAGCAASVNGGFESSYDYEAYRTTLDGSIELVKLTRKWKSFGRAINNEGDLLGVGDLSRDNNVWRPIVFTKEGVLIDVLTNTNGLPPVLLNSYTWGYVEAYDMNDAGVIVGAGLAGTGGGFMLIPQN